MTKMSGTKFAVTLGAAWLFAACFSGANVQGKHAKFHGCKADDVTVTEVESEGHTRLDTSGCGAQETYYCIGMKCRSPRLLAISHFSVETKCKENEVQTENKPNDVFELSGCGKQATYACQQVDNHVIDCKKTK